MVVRRSGRRAAWWWLVAAWLVLPSVSPVSAQAVLTGTVIDASTGAPLPGATVTVGTRGAATDADGRFRLAALARDTATAVVRFLGYATQRVGVDLGAGEARLAVRLVPDATALGEVRVDASPAQQALGRDVRAVRVLDADDLDALRGRTLGDIVATLNGVTVLTSGPTVAKPVVRGLHSDRVLILDNGVRQEGQQWGGEHAPEIDPFGAQRIEVVMGAAGVEYGAGAIGGVVRLTDAPLPDTPDVAGQLSLSAFSNTGGGAVGLRLESAPAPGLAWRLAGSVRRAGDARTPDFVMRNSAFAEASGHLTLGLRRGPVELEAHLRRFATEMGIYVGSHVGNARNLQEVIDRGGPDPAWNYRFSYAIDAPKQAVVHDVGSLHAHVRVPGGEVEAAYAVQRNRRQEFDRHRAYADSAAAPGSRPSFDLALWTHTADVSFTPRASGRISGRVGLGATAQLNRNGASGYLVPNYAAYAGGAFAHGALAVRRGLSVDAGARLDARWMEAFPIDRATRDPVRTVRPYAGASAAVGALWTLAPAWSVAANAGTAWRPPNVSELFAFGVHHGTAEFQIGDASLSTERSLDLSATLRHESRAVSIEASAYVNTIAGYVYGREQPAPTVTIRGTFPTVRTVQADARLAGLDAQAEWRPLGWLDVGARASLLRADNLTLGGPLHGVPSSRGSARARVHAERVGPVAEPFLEAEVQHVARQTRVEPGVWIAAPFPPAYTLVGLRAGASVRAAGQTLRVQVRVENALDARYRDALSRFRYVIDEPGRNVSVSVAVPLGPSGR